MELTIFWTQFAENELEEIFKYHKENASETIARKLVIGIIKTTKKLRKQPYIGQLEPELSDWENNFRYLIHKHYKIIYWLNHNQIEVADVFDTRQKPSKIKRNK